MKFNNINFANKKYKKKQEFLQYKYLMIIIYIKYELHNYIL